MWPLLFESNFFDLSPPIQAQIEPTPLTAIPSSENFLSVLVSKRGGLQGLRVSLSLSLVGLFRSHPLKVLVETFGVRARPHLLVDVEKEPEDEACERDLPREGINDLDR